MESNQRRKTNSAFEYFLYTAILAETGLAALIYKVIFRSGDLARMRIYFTIFYFAFLAWAISQLNTLHRNRNEAMKTPAPEPAAGPHEDTPPVLGLTGSQIAILVVVFATAIAAFSWALRVLL